jgi:manganese/iron transport system permease protein
VVLASDVFDSGGAVDRLLFGTLLGLDTGDLALSAGAAVLAVAGTLGLGRAWAAAGFDPEGATVLGFPLQRSELALLVLIALAAVAAIPAVGALLVTSLFVVPAATARLLTGRLGTMLAWSVALAAVEGLSGLYLAYWLDVPPGPAVSTLGAACYGVVALGLAYR